MAQRCTTKPLGPGLSLRTCRYTWDDGTLRGAAFDVLEHGGNEDDAVASLSINHRRAPGHRPTFAVSDVRIPDTQHRRHKLGTKLYEAALALACRERVQLTSSTVRSEFSEAFWRKQVRKGRARCMRDGGKGQWQRGSYYRVPKAELLEAGLTEAQFREATAKLPKPKRDPEHDGFWPCYRYAVKRGVCRDARPSLAKVRR